LVVVKLATREAPVPNWTDEEHLRFDIAFALKKLRVRGAKMDEMQRKMAAEQIVAHLKLCGYTHPKGARHVDE
jgi:hypothetical protein